MTPPKQMIMPGIDNSLSKAADAYCDLLEESQELNERKNKAAKELIEAMTGASKGTLRHRGRTLSIEEIDAQVKIKVSKFVDKK